MRAPTIHLNGSAPSVLLEAYKHAAAAVRNAAKALEETAPNARDYYPQGDQAFNEATLEHRDRMAHLGNVALELVALIDHVQDQVDQRTKVRP